MRPIAALICVFFLSACAVQGRDRGAFTEASGKADGHAQAGDDLDLTEPWPSRETLDDILSALDTTCGDGWCEGDVNLHFDDIDCADHHGLTVCTLLYEAEWPDEDIYGATRMDKTCHVVVDPAVERAAVRLSELFHSCVDEDLYTVVPSATYAVTP